MTFLEINNATKETIEAGFHRIANTLLKNYVLVVNNDYYRLIDIEFYYFAPGCFEDVYAHRHEAQLQMGKWYFHGSGIDINFGNGKCHGGILIRAIAKLNGEGYAGKNSIYKEIHGPLNVKTEIFSNMHSAFEREANFLYLEDVSRDPMGAGMVTPQHLVKTYWNCNVLLETFFRRPLFDCLGGFHTGTGSGNPV
ncbi:hypothetical protein FVR03_21245 [Pontibacter qinzhouensis]|uniref:Uncharacterized protein n=1 Tax=Pontibacter qinzhouensis TaxID=2603253 RepID=A0A5C8J0R0_9BACT|nr:hypothetical protein [Pontibacter qinzhouensis]TXK27232.1 hypothetical protein FVR03_21245 [Pontibacter qinzhouensis]